MQIYEALLPYPRIDPVLVHIGPLAIRWYALAYIAGLLLGWWLILKEIAQTSLWANPPFKGKAPANSEEIGDLVVWATFGVILGGRLGWVLFYGIILCSGDQSYPYCYGLPGGFLTDPIKIVAAWQGGMSFHGGLIGVMLAMLLFARKVNSTFFQLADFVAPLVPVGLAAGRLGNFINGELWGRPTDLPWGMVFPRAPDNLPRHPSQLYEFGLEGIVLFTVLWLYTRKERPRMAPSGLFLLLYGIFRFLVEFVRQPDRQLGFIAFHWMTMGQLLSLPMILVGIILLVWAYRRQARVTRAVDEGT